MSAETEKPKTNDDKQTAEGEKHNEKQRAAYFKQELRRLHKTMEREKSKIKEPQLKKHTPYTFNNLGPYLDMNTTDYIIKLDETQPKAGYTTRPTAIGLVDPWNDHSMDQTLQEPVVVKGAHTRPQAPKSARGRREDRQKQGSTHLPKYPVITLKDNDIATQELDYGQVPQLREDLDKRYSHDSEGQIKKEYVRTKQDFYRMELDKLKEIHPINRGNLRKAYFAYLQNTPGAKKAVHECIAELDEEERAEKDKRKSEREETQPRQEEAKPQEEEKDKDDAEKEEENES